MEKLEMDDLPRKQILRFAMDMERELLENDHKSGWSGMPLGYLLRRVRQEVEELSKAIAEKKNVVGEAADVANFCMMIADNWREEFDSEDIDGS